MTSSWLEGVNVARSSISGSLHSERTLEVSSKVPTPSDFSSTIKVGPDLVRGQRISADTADQGASFHGSVLDGSVVSHEDLLSAVGSMVESVGGGSMGGSDGGRGQRRGGGHSPRSDDRRGKYSGTDGGHGPRSDDGRDRYSGIDGGRSPRSDDGHGKYSDGGRGPRSDDGRGQFSGVGDGRGQYSGVDSGRDQMGGGSVSGDDGWGGAHGEGGGGGDGGDSGGDSGDEGDVESSNSSGTSEDESSEVTVGLSKVMMRRGVADKQPEARVHTTSPVDMEKGDASPGQEDAMSLPVSLRPNLIGTND